VAVENDQEPVFKGRAVERRRAGVARVQLRFSDAAMKIQPSPYTVQRFPVKKVRLSQMMQRL